MAFVDCIVVLEPRAMETPLRHFQDPRVAIVVPRILGLGAADATGIGDLARRCRAECQWCLHHSANHEARLTTDQRVRLCRRAEQALIR